MSALHFRCQYLHNYITVTLHPFSTSLISRWPAICLSFLHHNYLRDHLSLHHPQNYSICNKNKIHSRNYMNHRNHRNMVLSFSEYVYSQALLLNICLFPPEFHHNLSVRQEYRHNLYQLMSDQIRSPIH